MIPATLPASEPESAANRAAARGRWSERSLRFDDTPGAVLERLLDGDPLGLRASVGERLRGRCLLLDAGVVHRRALAWIAQLLVARRGAARGARPTGRWLRERIDEAIDALLEETAPGAPEVPGIAAPPDPLTRARAAFCRLPRTTREAFFHLVVEGHSLEALARASAHPAPELARRARSALQLFLDLPPQEPLR